MIGQIRDDENNIILDDVVKAEAMNDYFTAIGPTFASEINSAEGFLDYNCIKSRPQFHKFNLIKTSY